MRVDTVDAEETLLHGVATVPEPMLGRCACGGAWPLTLVEGVADALGDDARVVEEGAGRLDERVATVLETGEPAVGDALLAGLDVRAVGDRRLAGLCALARLRL